MGKGTIISGGTAGLYNITINLDRAKVVALIERMNEEIAVLVKQLEAVEADITTKQSEINDLNINIAFYLLNPKIYQKELVAASSSLANNTNELAALYQRKNTYTLQKKTLELRIVYLSANTPEDPTAEAWCADLTEDLTGDVGTIEVPGERGITLIQPGYSEAAAYDSERDGKLFPAICQTPEQCFYNYAMLPGWQKWLPTYRFGTITSIDMDNDTCNLTLEEALSSAQNVDINASAELTNVPIEYMSCNAGAFEIGDSVLVQCTNTVIPASISPPVKRSVETTYKVIGFKSNPKPCGYYLRLTCNGYTPINGGEIIRVGSENNTTQAGGLCGPFTPSSATEDDYPELYFNNSESGQYLFCYFKEVTPGTENIKLAWEVVEQNYAGRLKVNYDVSQYATTNNYVNLHEWLTYEKPLGECTYSKETINGKTYRVYQVDYTGLYLLRREVTAHFNTSYINTSALSCEFDGSSPPSPTYSYVAYVLCEYPVTRNLGASIIMPPIPCDEEDPEAAWAVDVDVLLNFVAMDYSLAGHNLGIIIDNDGVLTFDTIEIDLAAGGDVSILCSNGRVDPYCYEEGLAYPAFTTLKFEKVLTPEDHF